MERNPDILLKANQALENDLNVIADMSAANAHGHLIWCATYYALRSDDLEGLILEYYNKESDSDYSVRYPIVTRHYFFAPLKIFKAIGKKLFSKKIASKSPSCWFSVSNPEFRHRYRNVFEYLAPSINKAFFTNDHIRDINCGNAGTSLNFADYFKVADIFRAYGTARSVKKSIVKLKADSIAANWIKKMPVTHVYNMALRELWIERALKTQQPKAVFFATANTYSPARLMSRICKRNNIPFVVVACRSMFSPLRSEERVSAADLKEINDSRIADMWLMWDKFSINTLQGVKVPSDKIFLSQPDPVKVFHARICNTPYLLLLTHERDLNTVMIDEWLKICGDVKILAIRTHPLCKLTESQMEKLSGFEIDDISSVPMNTINFDNTVAVSINSTAAVEACSYGCGIFWMPYLNERSVIFAPIMNILGYVAGNSAEGNTFLQNHLDDARRVEFVNACTESYNENFKGTDNAALLFKKLNLAN